MKLNPDSMILSQLDGQWQKLFALLLFKLKGSEKVTITTDDMRRFADESQRGGVTTVFTHGHVDSIDFKLVTLEEARKLAEHDRMMRGGKQ